jgi:hypothetical protein
MRPLSRHPRPDNTSVGKVTLWGRFGTLVGSGFEASCLHQHLSLLQPDVECPGRLLALDSGRDVRASDCTDLGKHQSTDQDCAGQCELHESACCF